MSRTPALMAVHLTNASGDLTRVGALVRDRQGAVTFLVDELFIRMENRPVLSLQWVDHRGDEQTRSRLEMRPDKFAYSGFLPPWFAGLLPEGALRDLVEQEMGPGEHDWYDVLGRLGGDLPGAVIITPETDMGASLGVVRWDQAVGAPGPSPVPQGLIKFSLAGVQLKFNAIPHGDRFTMPARGGEGRVILKAPTAQYPGLPEAEYTAMTLARAAGVQTAEVRLVPVTAIDGVPEMFIEAGEYALAVDRFDRVTNGRVHIEDAAQIIGAIGDQKYTKGTTETVLNMTRRFSVDWTEDSTEGFRRAALDVLIGNGDNHLKNWSFRFADGVSPRLSPAYDIVPTVLYQPRDQLALRFAGARAFESVSMTNFRRAAAFLDLDPDGVELEVRTVITRALDLWPGLMREMPLPQAHKEFLLARLDALPLVQEARTKARAPSRRRGTSTAR